MGTLGLVTLIKRGVVIAKVTATCNGYEADNFAKEVMDQKPEDANALQAIAKRTTFGCESCCVISVRWHMGGQKGLVFRHHEEDELNDEYRNELIAKFDDPEAFPCFPHPPANCIKIEANWWPDDDRVDPDACLKRIEDAVTARDWQEFHEAHRDLEAWLDKDGTEPFNYSERMMAILNQLGELIAEAQSLLMRGGVD